MSFREFSVLQIFVTLATAVGLANTASADPRSLDDSPEQEALVPCVSRFFDVALEGTYGVYPLESGGFVLTLDSADPVTGPTDDVQPFDLEVVDSTGEVRRGSHVSLTYGPTGSSGEFGLIGVTSVRWVPRAGFSRAQIRRIRRDRRLVDADMDLNCFVR